MAATKNATLRPQRLQEHDIQTPPRSRVPLPHVLIVDDEPLIAESIYELLLRSGLYRVSVAAGGLDGQEQLERSLRAGGESIDLVLLDLMMPQLSGIELLHWIRSNPRMRYLRVLMLTGVSDKRDIVDALSEGADDYITKPYHPQELMARIKTTLRTQELEKQLQSQSRQLAMLNTISNTITRTLELKDLLEASVNGVRELLGVQMTAVFMQDGSRQLLRCQHVNADRRMTVSAEDFKPVPIGRGVISRAYTGRNTHCVNDAKDDKRFVAALDAPKGINVESIMTAPVFMRGHPIGVLVAMNKRRGEFAESDADLFVSLANTMSQAIENAWLFNNVRQRQQELLESRNTLQFVIDGILHPIYTINNSWEIVSVNATKANLEDGEANELVGQVCYRAFFNRDTPCEHCQVGTLLRKQRSQHWSVRWVGSDFMPQEWEVNAFPVPSTQDGGPRAVIVWQDRTEERRLETSLHQAAKLSAIGQLAAGVAHEINNPLTVIKTAAEMLGDVVPKENTEDYELVDWVANAAERAIKVVRGLLDFARQSRYEFESGSLKISIDESLDLVSYQLRKTNIEVNFDYADDIPDVVASWEHLKTVWINLLINARDALEEGREEENRRIDIRVRLAPLAGHVQVLFRDNGMGMPEEQIAHIFVPFFTTKDPGIGTGLGLATSHRIIDRHGGEVTCTSEPGVGTTFIIRLPVSDISQMATDIAEDAMKLGLDRTV